MHTDTPKEVTCKGGLMLTEAEEEQFKRISLDDIKPARPVRDQPERG